MKKIIIIFLQVSLFTLCFAQKDRIQNNLNRSEDYWDSIKTLDSELMTEIYNNLNKFIFYDTLGCDSVFQQYYSNGQLYSQIKYKKGMGYYEEYYSNGQLIFKSKYKFNKYIYSKWYSVNYDIKGNKFNTYRTGIYRFRKVDIVVHYKEGKKVLKRYYRKTHLLKEYDYLLKKWNYFDMNSNPDNFEKIYLL